jgi:transposase
MSSPKTIIIQQTLPELKALLKKASPLIAPRIKMLIEIKKNQSTGISKRKLAAILGVDPNSTQTWRSLYFNGGINAILTHKKKGFKPSVFTSEEHSLIEQKLKDPKNGLRGYVELLDWIEINFNKNIKYNTLLKYCIKNFHSKVKVARKSHIKKDEEAVTSFKKTSIRSAGKPLQGKRKNTKR